MKYQVVLEVIYPVIVEADNEEDAINKACEECPYDNEPAIDPIVNIIGE